MFRQLKKAGSFESLALLVQTLKSRLWLLNADFVRSNWHLRSAGRYLFVCVHVATLVFHVF